MYETWFRHQTEHFERSIVRINQKPAHCTCHLTQRRQEQQISCTWKGKGGGVDGGVSQAVDGRRRLAGCCWGAWTHHCQMPEAQRGRWVDHLTARNASAAPREPTMAAAPSKAAFEECILEEQHRRFSRRRREKRLVDIAISREFLLPLVPTRTNSLRDERC
jgi:hypothetical protein